MKKIKENESISIFWFRRDLRLDDNVGLYWSLKQGHPVLPIFIFDTEILSKLEDKNDARVSFIYDSLASLKKELNELGSDLQIFHGSPLEVWEKILSTYNVEAVFSNEDYEPSAIKRDEIVKELVRVKQGQFLQFKDQCIFSKNDILKKDGKPYTVYTAYKNRWIDLLETVNYKSYHCKKLYSNFLPCTPTKMISLKEIGFIQSHIHLNYKRAISQSIIKQYHLTRDIPSKNGTSGLGVHLRFGTVSPRKCVQIALKTNQTWLEELIWREFFMQILFHFPEVENAPFKKKYAAIKWINNPDDYKKWCEGKTGYPIVDAGMRELNAMGTMHNRARMIVASFLVKHLLIDWRWGEKYFARRLMDFDLSANNGNWQWVAGCGCDAAPYFRVFNPYTQQKKFDPDFEYIKKWVPEWNSADYPTPIIEHSFAYKRVKNTYSEALK